MNNRIHKNCSNNVSSFDKFKKKRTRLSGIKKLRQVISSLARESLDKKQFLSLDSFNFLTSVLEEFSFSKQNIKLVSRFFGDVLRLNRYLDIFSDKEKEKLEIFKKHIDLPPIIMGKNIHIFKGTVSKNYLLLNSKRDSSSSFSIASQYLEKFFSEAEKKLDTLPKRIRERLLECQDVYQYIKNFIFDDFQDSTPKSLGKILKTISTIKVKNDNEALTTLPRNVVTSIVSYVVKSIYKYNNNVLSDFTKQLSIREFLGLLKEHWNKEDFTNSLVGISEGKLLSKGTLKITFKPLSFLQESWYKNSAKLKGDLLPLMELINALGGKFKAHRSKEGDLVISINFPKPKEGYFVNNYVEDTDDIREEFYYRFRRAQKEEYYDVNISFPLKNKISDKQTANFVIPLSCIKEGEAFIDDLWQIEKLASRNNLRAVVIKNTYEGVQDSCFQDILMFFKEDNSSETFIQIPRYFFKDKMLDESLQSIFRFSSADVKLPFLSGAFIMGDKGLCYALSDLISDFEKETSYKLSELELLCRILPLNVECLIFDKNKNVILDAKYDIIKKKFVSDSLSQETLEN